MNTCTDSELASCEADCLLEANGCEGAEACLGVKALTAEPFSEGPYGTGTRDLAGPFELPTLDGGFSFADTWTGQESHIFLMGQDGWEYSRQLWKSQAFYWLRDSPDNVHYFSWHIPTSGESTPPKNKY